MPKKIDAVLHDTVTGEETRVSVPVADIIYNPYFANVPHEIFRLVVGGAIPVTPVILRDGDKFVFHDFQI